MIGDLPCSDPASRMSAHVALERPVDVIYIISLASLLIQLKVIRSEYRIGSSAEVIDNSMKRRR